MNYKAFFEQSSAMMVVLDTKFNIINASNQFLKVTITTREEIIGNYLFDVFPENPNEINNNSGHDVRASFNRVLKNKVTDVLPILKYDIPNPDGGFIQKYWKTSHSPILDENNEVKYITQIAEDVTATETLAIQLVKEKSDLKQLEDSEKRYNMLLMRSPFGFAVFRGKDMVITLANDSIKDIWGKGKNVEGKPLFKVLSELKDSVFPGIINAVYLTGKPFYGDELLAPIFRNGKLEDAYFNFIYQPYLDSDETIIGVTIIAYEVTPQALLKKAVKEQHDAEQKALKSIEESNKRYNLMLMHSPFTFAVLKGKDLIINLANDRVKAVWGKGNDIENKSLFAIMPELKNTPFPALMVEVMATGIPYHGNEVQSPPNLNGHTREEYFNFVFQPYMEADKTVSGITIIGNDVTEQVIAKRKIEESEGRFRLLVQQAPVAIGVVRGEKYVVEIANAKILEIWGRTEDQILNKPIFDVLTELEGQGFEELVDNVYKTGERFVTNELPITILRNGQLKNAYVKFVYEPLLEVDGTISGIMVLAHEITDLVVGRKKIEESEKHFRQLADLMPAKISNADTDCNVTYFNKQWLDYTGLDFEELKDLGYHKILHPDELEEFQNRFKKALETKTALEMEMRILDKNGDYKWHLNLASPVLDDNDEIKMWVGSTTEIHEQVKQKSILKKAVRERTKELERANAALIYQNEEKEKRADELIIANKELAKQNEEKEKRSKELVDLSRDLKIQQHELQRANKLLVKQDEKVSIINHELSLLNKELEKRVINRTKDLEESEARFRNMMETIPQISWTNTISGEFTFYNQRWYDYTGLNKTETNESGPLAVIHPDDLLNAKEDFNNILNSGLGGEFQIRGKRKDGLYRWHLIRLMPIKNVEENVVELWVGTATDIQELRVLQQQKDDFISIASHELKTPITALKLSLQVMNKMKENPSAALFANLIGRANVSLDKVSSLVENLLNTSKANENQIHLNQKLFVISKVADESCQHVKDEGLYAINIEGDLALAVYADAMRIDQVIINFVNNAIKYAPKSKQIIIKIEKLDGFAKVSVIDKGPGIDSEKVRHLFDRYYRVDSSGSQYSGLGLGLYISAEIIKKHNGQIGVDSELGKGSSFWFTLPL